jgi:hypothetical protein
MVKWDYVVRDDETTDYATTDYGPSEVREDFTGQGLRDYGTGSGKEAVNLLPMQHPGQS